MKFVKAIGSIVLILACLALIVWSGYFLWSALPLHRTVPQALSDEQQLQAVEEAPAPEKAAPEAPPAEEVPEELPEELPEPTPQPEPQEPDAPKPDYTEQAQALLDTMTLEEKLWQLFIVTPQALSGEDLYATETTMTALTEKPVGGVVYFASNIQDREQTINLLYNTQSYSRIPLFLAVDEEGGQVSRVGANAAMGVTHLPAAATYGEGGDAEVLYHAGSALALQLKSLGFNLDFAPVADIITNPNNTEIGNRAYSNDPATAATMVSAMVRGLQDNGMASCLKHFPGHGSTQANSHEGQSESTRTLDELRTTEWIPFSEGIDAGAAFVMVGHQTNQNLSPFPASLSPVATGYLRTELGFDGLIITDSLQMGAIIYYYTSAQAAVMAIQAGADMLLMPNDLQTAYDGLVTALDEGALTERRIDESVLRILKTKFEYGIIQ